MPAQVASGPLLTQLAFLVLWILPMVVFVRGRTAAHRDMAALFGTLGVAFFVGWLSRAGFSVPYGTIITTLLFVSEPYLLLRTVAHFQRLPPVQQWVALFCLVGSWCLAVLLAYLGSPTLIAIALGLAFSYVQCYATAVLVRTTRNTRGILHRRLMSIAFGAGMLELEAALDAIGIAIPALSPIAKAPMGLLGLVAVLAYYVGFAPPRWLRRSWQAEELQSFLQGIAGESAEDRLMVAYDHIGPEAAHALGASAGFLALSDRARRTLTLHGPPASRDIFRAAGVEAIAIDGNSPVISNAWLEQRPVTSNAPHEWGPQLSALARVLGAVRVLVGPITAHGECYGLIIILFEQRSPFGGDERGLFRMLAEQASLSVESSRLYRAERRHAGEREILLALSQGLAEETTVPGVIGRMGTAIAQLFGERAWGLLMPSNDGSLALVAAADGVPGAPTRGLVVPGTGIAGRALRLGEPVIVGDVREDPDYVPLAEGAQSKLVVPLNHYNQTLGVLDFESTQLHAFDESDLTVAQFIAADAALALARAQLVERLQSQNDELELAGLNLQIQVANLRSTTEELEAFSYSVSHDLRAPLRAMDGFARILLRDHLSGLDSEGQTYLQLIRENSEQMGQLIDDLLAFSRLTRIPLKMQRTSPERIVNQVWADLIRQLDDRQLELVRGPLPDVQADPALLKQVYANLLDNAVKYTRAKAVAVIEVGCQTANNEDIYYVKDNGVGFNMRYAGKLFGVFQRLHRAEDYEGTGVGLALVQRIINKHGGRVWVEAEPDRGATFYFTLGGRHRDG